MFVLINIKIVCFVHGHALFLEIIFETNGNYKLTNVHNCFYTLEIYAKENFVLIFV